jgi:Nuclease-related domain
VLAEHAARTTTGQADQAAERLGILRRAHQRHLGWMEAHDEELGVRERAVAREDAWRRRVDQRALALDPPGWLLAELGPVPTDPQERIVWRAAAAELDAYRRAYGLDHAGPAKHGGGRVARDGRAAPAAAPTADRAAGTGEWPGRHGRGGHAHRRADRGRRPMTADDQHHRVESNRLLGAQPRRQAPGRRHDWQAAQAALERLAGWSRHRDRPDLDRAGRAQPAAVSTALLAARNATADSLAGRREQHMRQHPGPNPDPDGYEDEEDLEALGTPFYRGSGLSVRALTVEELQQFLDAHTGQPARRLGSGWAALDPPAQPLEGSRVPPGAEPEPSGPQPAIPAERLAGSVGRPGRSALTQYRRRRAEELAGWTRSLAWRAPLVAAAGLVAGALADRAGLPWAGLVGLAAAAVLVGWRLRFRPSEQARAWQRGAHGERQTARRLDRLGRDGYVVFHDLAMPDSPANVDHLVIGPSGVFAIDSKQWTGGVHQGADGLVWHNHYRLDRTPAAVRWQAETLGRLLGIRVAPLVCVHGAYIQGGGLDAQGVAIVPATLLRSALGYERVLSEVDVERLAATAWTILRPAA